jgi:hypothetical protein
MSSKPSARRGASLLAAACAIAASAPAAEASYPGRNGRLAVGAVTEVVEDCGTCPYEYYGLVTTNADGTAVRDVFSVSLDSPARAVFSPNGRALAVAVGARIYLAAPDGSRRKRLARGLKPTWSPGGSTLAFPCVGDAPGICAIRVDGTRPRRVTEGEDPAWAPAAVRRGRNTLAVVREPSATARRQIFLVDVHTDSARRLTDEPAGATAPDWSPDGRKLVYIAGRCRIRVIDVRSGRHPPMRKRCGSDPTWSPDGSAIAFGSGPQLHVVTPSGEQIGRPRTPWGQCPVCDIHSVSWQPLPRRRRREASPSRPQGTVTAWRFLSWSSTSQTGRARWKWH